MQYLTYEEYTEIGGTLDMTALNVALVNYKSVKVSIFNRGFRDVIVNRDFFLPQIRHLIAPRYISGVPLSSFSVAK